MVSVRGPAVVYFAKVPAPGRVKTRLCPPLTPAEACALYRAFLIDGVRPVPGVKTFVWGWPEDELEALGGLVPAAIEVRPQRGQGLWERMIDCFATLFAEGYGPVLIRGTDAPDVGIERCVDAIERCRPGHVVFGPDAGGGYYLVALHAPRPELFAVDTEGADTVLAATVDRARGLGLEVHLLPVERDVDSFEDLVAVWRGRSG